MYNAEKGIEIETIKADTIYDGVIVNVEDGNVKKFITEVEKWKGSLEQSAINVWMEVKQGKQTFKCNQIFTYNENKDGYTEYSPKSNLGKFFKKYAGLPKLFMKVKLLSDSEGYLKLML